MRQLPNTRSNTAELATTKGAGGWSSGRCVAARFEELMTRRRVVFLIHYMPQYRAPFFSALREYCERANVDLRVIYGTPGKEHAPKKDDVEFAPGLFVRNKFIRLGRLELIWQPVLTHIRGADLVIIDQQNKLLLSYVLILRQFLGIQDFAFFGHGRNFQARNPNSLSERMKRKLLLTPHWWFVYTEGVARHIQELSYPKERTTVFNNTIDTSSLTSYKAEIGADELLAAKAELGIASDRVGIFVGSMYAEKKISFLLDACIRIKAAVPDFFMLFIGTGTDAPLVVDFCANHSWAKYLGQRFGREKVKYCMISNLLLLPGAVGLAVIDAFATHLPMATTEMAFHGPEVDYIINGYNGMIVKDSVYVYSQVVIDLLKDESRLSKMAENCGLSASQYSIENMARAFFEGISGALRAKGAYPGNAS
jgi:glycosyltransferase involved in cell wall biosynthesis